MNPNKILNLSINPGCGGKNCENCLNKGLPTCSIITVDGIADWSKLEQYIKDNDFYEDRVIGGDNPLKNCTGHLSFYMQLQKTVRDKCKKKLSVVLSYDITHMTQIVQVFNKIYVRMPNFEETRTAANLTWIKSFSVIVPYVILKEVRDVDIEFLKRTYYPKPIILTDGTKIEELRKQYPDFEFVSELYSRRSRLYSLSENKAYGTSFSKKWVKPYTELI